MTRRNKYTVALALILTSQIGVAVGAVSAGGQLTIEFKDSRDAMPCVSEKGNDITPLVIVSPEKGVQICRDIELLPANRLDSARLEALPGKNAALVDSVRLTNVVIKAKSNVTKFTIRAKHTIEQGRILEASKSAGAWYKASVLGRLITQNPADFVQITALVAQPPDSTPQPIGKPLVCKATGKPANVQDFNCNETRVGKWQGAGSQAGRIGPRQLILEVVLTLSAGGVLDLGQWVRLESVPSNE